MAVIDSLNTVKPTNPQASLVSLSMRKEFQKWLARSTAKKKYSAEVFLSCIDRISEYAIHKEISPISLWEYTQFSAFKPIYNKLSKSKMLRVSDIKTYKIFITVGPLYLEFLKEKQVARKIEDVVVPVEIKEAELEKLQKAQPTRTKPEVPPKPALDPAVVKQLTDVLSAHFANGYRLNSPIELERFRSFTVKDFGKEILLPEKKLEKHIAACGTTFDGKVYAVSAQVKERIKKLAEEYFADGARAIFFAEFYAKNEKWLFGENVVSENMLIEILRGLFPELSFKQIYFGYMDVSVFAVLESEILRVWGNDVLLTDKQLAERLQYIPLDRIKFALGQNDTFIWSNIETFSHVSRIDITDDERGAIREAAVRKCNAYGYVSITDLPLGEIKERNYELSITAVHNAVYRICMSDKFDKKGKIITRKGDVFDALTIMKKYCRTIDKCSLDDLLNIEKELTGVVRRRIPIEAGNTILVRIDRETFVTDRHVHFNADMIDGVIELFVKGDYLPLKSFTTFGGFLDCGHEWNLFLLESYCRRFSRRFRLDTPSVNSRNAGSGRPQKLRAELYGDFDRCCGEC